MAVKLFGCPIDSLQVAFERQCLAFEHQDVEQLSQLYVAWTACAQRSPKNSTNHAFAVRMVTWLNNKILAELY